MITKSLPRMEDGQLLAQALQRGDPAPGHESVVATALWEAGGVAGAAGLPALLRGVVRLLKARALGLAHMQASPRFGDIAAMLFNRGLFAQAVLRLEGNPTNPCYIALLLSLLDGKYPLPLRKEHRAFDRAHYPSFEKARVLCFKAIEPTLAGFKATVLQEILEGDPLPLQIHSALVVVKESEVLAMLHAMEQAGRPFLHRLDVQVGDPQSLLRILTHLDALNAHIFIISTRPG